VDAAIADLRNCTTIGISIDGVVFEDGTFVGPDTTGLFSDVDAMFKARRDLLDEVALRFGRSVDEVLNYIEEIASSPLPDRKLDREGLYDLYKKLEAEAVLRMRSATDDERVMEWLQHEHGQSWPRLKRL
jgi:hypothetical protein